MTDKQGKHDTFIAKPRTKTTQEQILDKLEEILQALKK